MGSVGRHTIESQAFGYLAVLTSTDCHWRSQLRPCCAADAQWRCRNAAQLTGPLI